jgi:hypothetical protein
LPETKISIDRATTGCGFFKAAGTGISFFRISLEKIFFKGIVF